MGVRTAMCGKITRQSRWNLNPVARTGQYRTKPQSIGEGVETGWRAPLVGEGTVRLSAKVESICITQRSVVQIHPPQPTSHVSSFRKALFCLRALELFR